MYKVLRGGILSLAALFVSNPSSLGDDNTGSVGGVLFYVQTDKPLIALTIDDGPDPITTLRILDVLKRFNAKATFFLITDYIKGNEAVVDAIASGGHELANHMTRDEPSIRLSTTEFETELKRSQQILQKWPVSNWFRPGSGWYNQKMVETLKEHGYRAALGTLYPLDAALSSSEFSSRFILGRAFAGGIIILHDRDERGVRTAETLEKVLPELINQGYRIVTLTELVATEKVNQPSP